MSLLSSSAFVVLCIPDLAIRQFRELRLEFSPIRCPLKGPNHLFCFVSCVFVFWFLLFVQEGHHYQKNMAKAPEKQARVRVLCRDLFQIESERMQLVKVRMLLCKLLSKDLILQLHCKVPYLCCVLTTASHVHLFLLLLKFVESLMFLADIFFDHPDVLC